MFYFIEEENNKQDYSKSRDMSIRYGKNSRATSHKEYNDNSWKVGKKLEEGLVSKEKC